MTVNSLKRDKIFWNSYHLWKMVILAFNENFECLKLFLFEYKLKT